MKRNLLFVLIFLLVPFFTACSDKPKGKLRISADMKDIVVYINGKKKAEIGEGYTNILLPEGDYEVSVEKPSEDGKWIYRGMKKVFVGSDTSVKIDLEIKKTRVPSEKFKKTSEIFAILKGHTDNILDLAIADGKIVSSSYDTIRIWDLNSGRFIKFLEGHANNIFALAIADGKIVSGSYNDIIKILDLNSGRLIKSLGGHPDCIISDLAIADRKIVSSSSDGTIKIWDLNSGRLIKSLKGHTRNIVALAIADGKIVSGSYDGTIIIWKMPK